MTHFKRSSPLLALLFFLAALAGCSETGQVTRNTPSGPVTGVVEKGVEMFKGIPFAGPPTGEDRWKEPRPAKPWTENLPCTRFRPSCIQPEVSELEGGGDVGKTSEDCLYLNIWSPVKRGHDRLPVMVWIHGGAFMTGSGSASLYSGANLAKKGVVVVTINYRLGPFGFLAHPALSAESARGTSGNYGLLDQIEALKWVKTHIASFGGDPGRVTIFGESAGAFSVGVLLISPLARGLFHRAILQSGAPTGQKYIMPTATGSMAQALATGRELASRLGVPEKDAVRLLRQKTAAEVMNAADMSPEFIFKKEGLVFAPVIDGWVVPAEPEKLLSGGAFARVPVMAGANRDESSLFIDHLTASGYRTWLSENFGGRAEEIAAAYPLDEKGGPGSPAARFLTALWFVEPARTLSRAVAAKGGRAYLYYFTHVPENGLLSEYGAFHGQEIEYVFGNLGIILPTDYDRALSRTMMDYWVAFAATGDPNSGKLPRWVATDAKKDVFMEFGEVVGLATDIDKAASDFVERVKPREQVEPGKKDKKKGKR